MEQIIEMITTYASIWVPSLVAVVGMVGTIFGSLTKTRDAIKEFKDDESVKNLNKELKQALADNKEIKQELDIVIDQLAKIENYRKELEKK